MIDFNFDRPRQREPLLGSQAYRDLAKIFCCTLLPMIILIFVFNPAYLIMLGAALLIGLSVASFFGFVNG